MSVQPSSSRSTPPLPSTFPQPPSFSSSPSRNRRAAPAFPPPTSSQPYASTSAYRFQQSSLDSPTTPASVRVPSPPRHRRTPSSSNGSEDGRPPPTPRQVYGGAIPRGSRARSSTLNGGAGGGPTSSSSPPREYVLSKLRELAPMFHRVESNADIRVLVPITSPQLPTNEEQEGYASPARRDSGTPPRGPATAPMEGRTSSGSSTPSLGRRGSAPSSGEVTVRTYHLHREYLTTQSSLFRKLLNPSSNLHHHPTLPPTPTLSRTSNPSLSARLIPSQPPSTRPTILLPLPDPDSFGLLVHYLYFGNPTVVERALSDKKISWRGLFSNIEYLGLDAPLKLVCSRWWRTWIRPMTTDYGRQPHSAGPSTSSRGEELVTPPPPMGREYYEQVTPTMSTFPGREGGTKVGPKGLVVMLDVDEDEGAGGLRELDLERRMMDLGRRGT